MKRQHQKVTGIVDMLTPVEASWLDDHASDCVSVLKGLPERDRYGAGDIHGLLEEDFQCASTVIRLFLDFSKDEMTLKLKEALGGEGGIGVKRYRADPDGYVEALLALGLSDKMTGVVHAPLHWSDILVERLKGGRGSAIKGQQRGRSLEDFTEALLRQVYGLDQIDPRCRFRGASGISTEKADFAVPSKEQPQLLIEAKAYGATGSKQTDILGDIHRIVEEKRDDTLLMLITDGLTWKERLSDLRKLVELQNTGRIYRIYTRAMADDLLEDLRQFKREAGI